MDHSFHFISYDMRVNDRRKTGFYELDLEQSVHRAQLIRDIAGWQFEDIDRVYCGEIGAPFADVTFDIAEEVLALCSREDSTLLWELRNWLENILGCLTVEEAMAEAPMVPDVSEHNTHHHAFQGVS